MGIMGIMGKLGAFMGMSPDRYMRANRSLLRRRPPGQGPLQDMEVRSYRLALFVQGWTPFFVQDVAEKINSHPGPDPLGL